MTSERASDSSPCAGGAAGVRPLLSGSLRVLVDGHPICSVCGAAVRPTGPDEWRHAPRGASAPPRITPTEVARLPSYAAFKTRFPWASASEDEWREGADRLARFGARFAALRRSSRLTPGGNPLLELVNDLAVGQPWRLSPGLAQMLDLGERRRELASRFSWAIPTDEALSILAKHAPLIECGAGMGYWTALLRSRGVDAVAYDLAPPGSKARNPYHASRHPWVEVGRAGAATAARKHRDRALLLCWPPYDDDAASYAALRAYRGDVVIHIGERDEGATGSVRFHRELRLNWTLVEEVDLPHWPNLRDRVMVYRRNPRRLPHRERDRCFECGRYISTGAIGRCDACFERRPPALALRVGRHRLEYPREMVDAMPAALRKAFEASPSRIR